MKCLIINCLSGLNDIIMKDLEYNVWWYIKLLNYCLYES